MLMRKSDPFGFDISVSSAKKKTRGKRGMSGAFETSTRACEHEGCTESGQYRAPKSPDNLDEYFWFCKTHVREYNLKWNFFTGATEEESAQAASSQVAQVDAGVANEGTARRRQRFSASQDTAATITI